MQRARRKRNQTILIAILVVVLVSALSIIGVVIALGFQKSNDKTTEVEKKPEPVPVKQVETPVEEPPAVETVAPKIDFQGLWAVNPDAYAFIEIPGTQVNYPVMQSSTQEEDYYLNVTFEGVAALPGSIYTRMINAKDFSDPITVIYGHDMLDGSYFGDLKNYVDRAFFDTYRDLFIYLPDRQLQYQIIAEVVHDDSLISNAHDLKDPNSVPSFIQECMGIQEAQNQFAQDMNVTPEDRLITLSTCIGDRPNNRRLIIAKFVNEKYIETQPAAAESDPAAAAGTPENAGTPEAAANPENAGTPEATPAQ